jgi:DNA gyrase/topoisomerase IV subunit A
MVRGPDFPTGGIVVDDWSSIVEAYKTGRGSFRVRARWHQEDQGRGTWVIVVTEIPYGVQKSRLIEKTADCCWPENCRCSTTSATRAPKTSASCWCPRAAPSIPRC